MRPLWLKQFGTKTTQANFTTCKSEFNGRCVSTRGYALFADRQYAGTQFVEREGQFADFFSANCHFELAEACRDNLPDT